MSQSGVVYVCRPHSHVQPCEYTSDPKKQSEGRDCTVQNSFVALDQQCAEAYSLRPYLGDALVLRALSLTINLTNNI